jgi:hypothetical protein
MRRAINPRARAHGAVRTTHGTNQYTSRQGQGEGSGTKLHTQQGHQDSIHEYVVQTFFCNRGIIFPSHCRINKNKIID